MTFRAWQVLVVGLIFAIVTAAASMVYANRVANESERRWCGLIVALDDAYTTTPPQSELGERIAIELVRLRGDFHCPERV